MQAGTLVLGAFACLDPLERRLLSWAGNFFRTRQKGDMNLTTRNWRSLFVRMTNPALISLIWLGISAGVSFVAVPAIFGATTVDRVAALGVSRSIFEALGQTEIVALIALLLAVRLSDRTREYWHFCAALALLQLTQTAWLIPALAARTDMIISGIEPPSSIIHGTYGVMQLLKLLLLLIIGLQTQPSSDTK